MRNTKAIINYAVSLKDIPFLIGQCAHHSDVAFLSRRLWHELPDNMKKQVGNKRYLKSSRTQDLIRGIQYLDVVLVTEKVCIEHIQKQKERLRNGPVGMGVKFSGDQLNVFPLFSVIIPFIYL